MRSVTTPGIKKRRPTLPIAGGDDESVPEITTEATKSIKDSPCDNQLAADSENLWFTDLAVDHPRSFLCVCYTILIVVAAVAFSQNMFVMSDNHYRDFLVWRSEVIYNLDMRFLLLAHVEKFSGAGEFKPLQSQENVWWMATVVYENREDAEFGLITKDSLLKIQEIEDWLVSNEQYTHFCLADLDHSTEYVNYEETGVVCKNPYSALRLWEKDVLDIVDPTLSGTQLADMTQEQIVSVFEKVKSSP